MRNRWLLPITKLDSSVSRGKKGEKVPEDILVSKLSRQQTPSGLKLREFTHRPNDNLPPFNHFFCRLARNCGSSSYPTHRMTTLRKSESAIVAGAKRRGPTSLQGKLASSQNEQFHLCLAPNGPPLATLLPGQPSSTSDPREKVILQNEPKAQNETWMGPLPLPTKANAMSQLISCETIGLI